MKFLTNVFFLVLLVFSSCSETDQTVLSSPDGRIKINIETAGDLAYNVIAGKDTVITRSKIEFDFKDAPTIGNNLKLLDLHKKQVDESWTPILKRFDIIRNHYNEMILECKENENPARSIKLELRAYNNGIAFRVIFLPGDSSKQWTIMDENTEFNFKDDPICWAADYKSFDSHQESEFNQMRISEINDTMFTGLPLTVMFSEHLYATITEAALVDYAGMYLRPGTKNNTVSLKTQLAPRHGQEKEGEKVLFRGMHSTPWRVIMIAETPGELIESEIIQNLNEPCQLKETSWIKPGISAWDHWWSGDVKMEQDVIYDYIDLASEMGWEYMLIDWQWYGPFDQPGSDITKVAPQLNMPEILEYAKSKNVRCWLWLYWTDVDKADFNAACKLYTEWGIAGVKIDFMARDDQEMVNWYHKIVKIAAKNQLMVDFHGAYKPTGWRRTYPNLLTREGVMGNEYNKWSSRVTPDHDCTLPFTRMLAGPMDYTPGGFLNSNKEDFKTGSPTHVQGTRAHELAKFVVFDSPFTVACDHPDHYKNQAGEEFLKEVTSVWDDTKVLNGEIGKYITIVRRSGTNWFIGSMTNSDMRTLEITLDFLNEDMEYEILSYSDSEMTNKNAQIVEENVKRVSAGDKLIINMKSGGGYAAILIPKK